MYVLFCDIWVQSSEYGLGNEIFHTKNMLDKIIATKKLYKNLIGSSSGPNKKGDLRFGKMNQQFVSEDIQNLSKILHSCHKNRTKAGKVQTSL